MEILLTIVSAFWIVGFFVVGGVAQLSVVDAGGRLRLNGQMVVPTCPERVTRARAKLFMIGTFWPLVALFLTYKHGIAPIGRWLRWEWRGYADFLVNPAAGVTESLKPGSVPGRLAGCACTRCACGGPR